MRSPRMAAALALAALYATALPAPAPAQVLTSLLLDWREQVWNCDDDATGDYDVAVHVAMFEAANAIARRYEPYTQPIAAPAGASQEAAAAAAAHGVLAASCPSQKDALDGLLQRSLDAVVDSAARVAGAEVGRKAAEQVLALRDGAEPMRESPFMTGEPGVYVPTTRRVGMNQAVRRPWIMRTPDEVRPAPPPSLDSDIWARDYEEIRRLGGRKSTERTAVQTDIARFWSMESPLLVLRQLVGLPGRSLVDDARLLALLTMAFSDSYTAMMDGKYAFNFWRPVTAIRGGGHDGNDATVADSTWLPLVGTPLHPEYPCGHCLSAGAVGAVLEAEFGDAMPVLVVDREKVLLRRWRTAREFIDEVSEARLLGGVHYRFSVDAGRDAGIAIGRLAVERYMRPVASAHR